MKNLVLTAIKEMDDNEIVRIWNEFCQVDRRYDDEIFDAYMMEEYINNSDDGMAILNRFYFGNDEGREGTSANPNRNFFYFNGYANIVSFDYIYNQYTDEFFGIDADLLVDYIVENEEAFDNDELQEILDGATIEE